MISGAQRRDPETGIGDQERAGIGSAKNAWIVSR